MILQRAQSTSTTLAQTVSTLRTDLETSSTTISRLTTSNTTLHRQTTTAQSALNAAQASQRTAEKTTRILKEKLARTEKTVAEIRTMCANDIRKRDLQIAKLKGFLSDRQRGATGGAQGKGMVGPSCTITGGGSRRAAGASRSGNSSRAAEPNTAPLSVQDASYTLQQESNEFLTQLSQSLSDENDALINLIRTTLNTLRDIQGHKTASHLDDHDSVHYAGAKDSGISIPPIDLIPNSVYSEILTPPSIDTLSTELTNHLANLRDLLSNPSFAPVEEVQVREEEIQRLREGWEKMEMRWKEAVGMMLSFRQRMVVGDEESPMKKGQDGKRWQEEMDELTRGLDEVTMTMEGINERRKNGRVSLGGRQVADESMAEDDLFDSSRVEESAVEESGIEEEQSIVNTESVLEEESMQNEGVQGDEDETTTVHNSVSAHESTPTRNKSNTRRLAVVPPVPSRSPLRNSKTSDRLNRSNDTPNNSLPPPSAMRDTRSRNRHETRERSTGDDTRGLSRKVSFKHLQSPSIINASALENDVDELG